MRSRIDEIDRADVEFEAFLLEVLSDFQVTVPELGTIAAKHQPMVLLTSNNTRELSEALKRRCLYLYVDYPAQDAELDADLVARLPETYARRYRALVLKETARALREQVRAQDLIGRWGGEEFMILTPNALTQSVKMAEHLRVLIDTETRVNEKIPYFSCSFGVVSLNNVNNVKDGIKQADQLLYQSKSDGRNIILID